MTCLEEMPACKASGKDLCWVLLGFPNTSIYGVFTGKAFLSHRLTLLRPNAAVAGRPKDPHPLHIPYLFRFPWELPHRRRQLCPLHDPEG